MSLVESNRLKKITIKDIIKFVPLIENGTISCTISYSRNSTPTGTIGLTTVFDKSEPVKITLDYSMVDSGLKRNENIPITTIYCNYGGKRYFFNCPACSNRCYKLYFLNTYFRCRTCQHLTYENNNRSHRSRDFDKMFSLLDIYESTAYQKANRYPTYKGEFTRNYLLATRKIGKIDTETLNHKLESMLKT